MKARVKALGIENVRVNNAGCLERCELGPAMVIYPEGIWYHYDSEADVDEIIESHILKDRRVERLLLADGQIEPESQPLERLDLLVVGVDSMGDQYSRIELKSIGMDDLPAFDAGAYLSLFTYDQQLRDCYWIASSPADLDRYLIYQKKNKGEVRGDQGRPIRFKVGDVIQAHLLASHFALAESAAHHTLVGEGIGFAPLLAMIARLNSIRADYQVHFFVSQSVSCGHLDELRSICNGRLTLYQQANRSTSTRRLVKALGSCPEGSQLYLCAARGLVDEVTSNLPNWPLEAMHVQHYQPRRMTKTPSQSFNVTLARRQKTIRVHPDETILDVLKTLQLPVDYACENGLCGACRVAVLYGKVEHRDSVLTSSERLHGDVMMACVSRAAESETRLILDV